MTAPTDRPHPLRPQRSLDLPELRRALEGWLQQGWLPERELCVGWFGLPLPALDVDGRPSAPLRLPGLRLVLAATPQVGSDEAPAAAPTTPAIPAPPPGLLLASPAPQDSELALLDLLITGDAHLALRADALARPIWWIDRADAPSEPPSTPQLRRFPADTADMPGAALAAALAMWASTHSPARRPLAGCLDEQQAVVAAIAAFQQGDQRGATLAARNLLVAAPQRSDLWHLLGLVAQQAGDLPQAHACFSHVTRLTPGYLEGWRCLSLSCLARGAADDALQAVQHGVALAPGDAGLRALHARILQALGLTHLAATEADNALALAPDDLNALLARAHSSQLLGQPDQAIALYQQALPRHPASLELQFRLGQALLRAGRSDQAQLHLAHVVDATQPSQPLHRQALLQLIDAQADCGALQPAAASARQALALDPADLAALRRCASLERRTGGRTRALQALAAAAQALGRLPTDLAALQAQLGRETGAHLLAPPSSPTGTAR
ncbi:MAG TPA: tetratricopeptide repeat protein, partial [Burkholderiaceae bacterium]|nr:tetratricopeptide repeat protein [Burkholderiaceae bacterium]